MDTDDSAVPITPPHERSKCRRSTKCFFVSALLLTVFLMCLPFLLGMSALIIASPSWTRGMSSTEKGAAEGAVSVAHHVSKFLNTFPGKGMMLFNALFFAFLLTALIFRSPKKYRIGAVVFTGLLAPVLSLVTFHDEQEAFNKQASPLIAELSEGGYFVKFNPVTHDLAGVAAEIVPDERLLALMNHKETIRRKEIVMYKPGFLDPDRQLTTIQGNLKYHLTRGSIDLYFNIWYPGATEQLGADTFAKEKAVVRREKIGDREFVIMRSDRWTTGAVVSPMVLVSVHFADLAEDAKVNEDQLWGMLQEISKNIRK